MSYYVLCDDDSRHESMTKEEILAAITQAVSGEAVIDPDAGILTKVKETNSGGYITFWVGTQAQYNALNGEIVQNCLYIITDDTLRSDIENAVAGVEARIEAAVQKLNPTRYSPDIVRNVTYGGGEDLTNFSVESAVFNHSEAAGVMYVKIMAVFCGSMAAGETMQMSVSNGPAFTEAVTPDVLQQNWTANTSGTPKPDVQLQAYFQAGAMYIRADKAFSVSEDIVVIFTGHYMV